MKSTFTVLVSVELDEGQKLDNGRVSEIVQCALEEGTSCSGGFLSAQVDAFKGRVIVGGRIALGDADRARLDNILPLHL